MRISGFTIVKNAVKFHYPIVESINSILPICDEYIVCVGKSEDETLELIRGINSPKIRIIETEWDLSHGYQELTRQTNIALKACTGDWAFYLQSDEVIHQDDLLKLKLLMQYYLHKPEVDALRFWWLHFYGSHYRYRIDQGWYQKQERIIRNNGTIESYHDAFGFHRKDGKKLNIRNSFTYLYHYGWTYTPEQMAARKNNQADIWQATHKKSSVYNYGDLSLFPVYWGTHPRVMNHIIAQNPVSQADAKEIHKKFWWHPSYFLKIRLKTSRRVRMKINPLDPQSSKRILIIRAGNIGDVLMATPVVKKLKAIYPGACVDFCVSPQGKTAIVSNTRINNVYVIEKAKNVWGKFKRFLFENKLRANRYDYCIVIETHTQYHQLAKRITPFGKTLGFHAIHANKDILDFYIEYSKTAHVIEQNLSLLRDYFKVAINPLDFQMDFYNSDAVQAQTATLLGSWNAVAKRYVVLHPGASVPHVPNRSWVAAKHQELAKYLNSKGYSVFVTGTVSETELVESVTATCDTQLTHSFIGHSYNEFALLIRHAAAVVCADTGALHLARAVGTPVVGLFGSTNPSHTGFIGEGPYQGIRNDFKCGPCIDNVPAHKQECLNGEVPACMQSITVDQVKESLRLLIGVGCRKY